MNNFNSIEALARSIKSINRAKNNKKVNLTLLYAFNATGKTRLTIELMKAVNDKALCFNAFIEDLFKWNNDENIFLIDSDSWVIEFIKEQGIENDIIDNFRELVDAKIEPEFSLERGEIIFSIVSGDDNSEDRIKISKGEEGLFKWSIFYTVLSTALDVLNNKKEDRVTEIFNELEYAIIDDPISSIDDTKIIMMATKLVELLNLYNNDNHKLNFLITTHHALFYNVLHNSFKGRKGNKKFNFEAYVLSKNDKKFELLDQKDTPFGYHLVVKNEIQKAINSDKLKKYHFNLFRSLLEKTANFLGYDEWTDCISGENNQKFIRIINLYSHGKLSELEYGELLYEDKKLFIEVFDNFNKEFKWR